MRMSHITKKWFKAGVCLAVVNNLKERGIMSKQREYLESVEDVDKAYIIANRYKRKYISLDDKKDRKEFSKEVSRFEKMYLKSNSSKWLINENIMTTNEVGEKSFDNAIVDETYEEFVSKIEEADRSIMCNQNSKEDEIIDDSKASFDGLSLIKMAIEKGVNKFSKKFLDLIGVEKEFVGFRDDVELYYCKSVNSIFETI
jgi:hypothetical protein